MNSLSAKGQQSLTDSATQPEITENLSRLLFLILDIRVNIYLHPRSDAVARSLALTRELAC